MKLFGSTPALIRVNLSVPAGAICALTGGNGAGKTTLLRILATAVRPTAGTALVCGFDVQAAARSARLVTDFASADGGFYPELSPLENLRFATAMRGVRATKAEIESALERAGLGIDASMPVRALSTGMRRRLALARLSLTRPQLALLDEPYASLDEPGRRLVGELLAEARAEGRAAIVATHEHARVGELADLVIRLERGLLAATEGAQMTLVERRGEAAAAP